MAGLDPAGAELIRFGQNAIYQLKDQPYVVRIARATEPARVQTEVRVARWLAENEFPATRLADIGTAAQPFEAGDRLVTVWALVEQSPDRPTMTDLGYILRGLHDLIPSPSLDLGPFEPFRDLPDRLERAPASVHHDDVEFLRQRGNELGDAYADLSFDLPEGPIHGDAHPGNLMRDTNGTVILTDLECFAIGPRESDIALPAAYRYGLSWLSDEGYRTFTQVYGYDVSKAECFPVLRAMREVNMTAWLMQNVDESDAIRAEFNRRMADLRNPDAPRSWHAF
jgi:Ser/Thr protein kinase RdoA (MazF antagonist)